MLEGAYAASKPTMWGLEVLDFQSLAEVKCNPCRDANSRVMPVTARALSSTEVHTVTLPYARSSATYTTILRLEKATPTSQPNPHSGLSASSIGAIVGSILGFIALLLLIYYCCIPRDSGDGYSTSNSDYSDSPPPRKRPPPKPTGKLPENIIRKPDGGYIQTRKPRPQHRAPMNQLSSQTRSNGPNRRETMEIVDESD